MEKKILKEALGCLPKALLFNFIAGALALLLGVALGGPKIDIAVQTANLASASLLLAYAAVTFWSVLALKKYHLRENLVVAGPYKFVRHPMYGAIVFLLNPALGIFFRSWFLLLAAVPIYFIWRHCVKIEDFYLADKFGDQWRAWQWQTGQLFPRFWRLNKPVFFAFWGLIIFLLAFVVLNFSAVYLRWAVWEKTGETAYNSQPNQQISNLPFVSSSPLPGAAPQNIVSRPNSIIISQLDIDAPLVFSQGTSQKELNAALNQGVVIYPGSALPGQNGEVFLTGHSSTYIWNKTPYGQIFTLLDKLKAGDIVSLIYENRQYNYRIIGQEILSPSQVKLSATAEPRLTLMTCWPIGTSAKRLVIRGELVE
ncbi:MAG: sortase [Candidatus Portnoybacteria bacterium]|jgi:LPXTG-site transpeptidase (sortase) family protein|nr:sortase [Candidatus Portnoybacteria bacterium]